MSEYKKIENAKGQIKATLEGEKWEAAKAQAYKKVAAKVEIKGFRKGQAPKSLVDKYINRNEIYLEAAEALAQGSLEEAIKEHDLELIDRPALGIEEINEEKCVLTFDVAVMPDLKLGDYKAIKYEEEKVEVTDKDVDDDIANLLDRKADLELKEDGAVEDGDTAVIDFEGFLDGVAFEGGKGENYDLVIGSNSFIPGFEPQLIGMKAEESKDINVTFPEDYGAENLKGKAAVFKVTVHEIKKKVLPVLNDEFVEELKYDGVKTVEDLRNYTKTNLTTAKENQAKNKAEEALLEKIVEIVEVDIPEVMIKAEQDSMYKNYEARLAQQGLAIEQFLKITNQTADQVKATMKDEAIKRIKVNMGLNEIGKLEKIEVSDEDMNKEYEKMAADYGMTVDELKSYLPEANLKEDMKLQKTLDLLKK